MCWNQPLILNNNQEYIQSFTGCLFAFVMAFPDNNEKTMPERVAKSYRNNPDEFTENDIGAAEVLGARGHAKKAANHLQSNIGGNVRNLLRSIDCNWRLFELEDNAWEESAKPAIKEVIEEIKKIEHVGFSVGTKLLYLKRPHLFPICDKLVAKRVIGREIGNVGQFMDCIEKIRKIGKQEHNLEAIRSAVRLLNTRLTNNDAYKQLSLVRALDAVVWFIEQKQERKKYAKLFI